MSPAKAQSKRGAGSGGDLLDAAFALIAEGGLAGYALRPLADRAGVSMLEVHRELPGRRALLRALSERVDETMLGIDLRELADLPPRDRVFELIMRRLDALTPYRAGLVRLRRDLAREPLLALVQGCRLERSMRWLQEAAGLPGSGVRARVRRGMIGAVYLRTLEVWLGDESTDLARTMAELDKGLRRIEAFAGLREGRSDPLESPTEAPLQA